jgi:hypothetical protein
MDSEERRWLVSVTLPTSLLPLKPKTLPVPGELNMIVDILLLPSLARVLIQSQLLDGRVLKSLWRIFFTMSQLVGVLLDQLRKSTTRF